MDDQQIKQNIAEGKTVLGIELGSTRIKSVLIGNDHIPLASGSYGWENRLEDGIWTYHLDEVWLGIQNSFRELAQDVQSRYGVQLTSVGAIGISAMMHGYLTFDANGKQLAPFRTWRNTTTDQAASLLTEKFQFNIPQRWSIAHLYQSILNNEAHTKDIDFITTLSGYVHWKLTGKKVLGIGDASGMFPIDCNTLDYNSQMMNQFDTLIRDFGPDWKLEDILPKILNCGEEAGSLTEEGAGLLDPTRQLKPSIPLCPPEGDAGTGMVATNSISERTGNISAGTSVFVMIVLEKALSKLYKEIDIVTTPAGKPVAMVHCNNCTTDIDSWVKLFGELIETLGFNVDKTTLYGSLYNKAMEAEADGGGLLCVNYHSGEHITGFEEGRPLLVRTPDSRFTLANFMRAVLFSAMSTLKLGMNILTEKENVRIDQLLGHGGLFKIKGVGQSLLAAAMNVPVTVMESAGEGGAWGIAILAAYMQQRNENETLDAYLNQRVFDKNKGTRVEPKTEDIQGFIGYMERYVPGLAIERAAVEYLK